MSSWELLMVALYNGHLHSEMLAVVTASWMSP